VAPRCSCRFGVALDALNSQSRDLPSLVAGKTISFPIASMAAIRCRLWLRRHLGPASPSRLMLRPSSSRFQQRENLPCTSLPEEKPFKTEPSLWADWIWCERLLLRHANGRTPSRALIADFRSAWSPKADRRPAPAATGRPSHHPSVLLKLYTYGLSEPGAVEPSARTRGRTQRRGYVAAGSAGARLQDDCGLP